MGRRGDVGWVSQRRDGGEERWARGPGEGLGSRTRGAKRDPPARACGVCLRRRTTREERSGGRGRGREVYPRGVSLPFRRRLHTRCYALQDTTPHPVCPRSGARTRGWATPTTHSLTRH